MANSLIRFFSAITCYVKEIFTPHKKETFERIHRLEWTRDYYSYHLKSQPGFEIDSRTWADLDMDRLFLKLDHTLTAPGEQVLYALLHQPCLEEAALKSRCHIINALTKNRTLQSQLNVILKRLGHESDGDYLAEYLWRTPSISSQRIYIYWLAYFAVLAIPVLFIISPPAALYSFVALFMMNTFLHSRVQQKLQTELGTITYLGRMLQAAVKLSDLHDPDLEPYLNTFRTAKIKTKQIRRKLALGTFFSHSADQLAAAFNVLLLMEVRRYFSVLHLVNRDRMLLQEVYSGIGFLDAMQAVVSYRGILPYWSEPELEQLKTELYASNIYHPLLTNPVSNTVHLVPAGIVITGSNMSGKSTFLKTIGVNVLLAQTIVTVAAESYSSCFWKLMSAIGRTDNLIEGKSYYLDEALAVLRVIETANQNQGNCLFIMDELFRGTNSGERVAAAVAVINFLATHGCCTLIATHDMEITQLVEGMYRNYHFQEQLGETGLIFDYKLLNGPSERTNAIEILQYVGYPLEIIQDANRIIG